MMREWAPIRQPGTRGTRLRDLNSTGTGICSDALDYRPCMHAYHKTVVVVTYGHCMLKPTRGGGVKDRAQC